MVREMQAAVAGVLSVPAIRARFAELGNEPIGSTPEAFREFIQREMTKYEDIIQRVGISVT
jgi:tripartite-type tricarboxylate transporter receptor subunit TctC